MTDGAQRSGLKAVAVGAVLLAIATACSHGDAAQTAETQSSQAAPAPVAPRLRRPADASARCGRSPYDFCAVSTLINDAIAANELPGAVVQIGHGGQVVFHQAYGERKLAGEPGLDGSPAPAEPMTEDTIFDMASLTKPLATAPAVMQLFEQGKVAVRRSRAEVLAGLQHCERSSACRGDAADAAHAHVGRAGDVELKIRGDWTQVDRAEGFRRALTTPLESPPGAGFRYSDINFILLGLLVEKLTGETEDDYVQQQRLWAAGHDRHPLSARGQGVWSARDERSGDRLGSGARARRSIVRRARGTPVCCRGSRRRLGTRRAEASRTRIPISITCCGAR